MWKHKNFINLQLCATLEQLYDIYVFVDLVPTKIGQDYSGTPGVTPSITIAENKITSTTASFYNITENNYASASSDSKELLIKDGWKIKYVEYPYIVGDGGTRYNVGDSFNATGTGNGLYITLEQSTPTLTFKHFYDAGAIGTGTYKFRHYSQQAPSSGETWVLNETIDTATLGTYYINFTTVGTSITNWKALNGAIPPALEYYPAEGDGALEVYSESSNTWTNQAYRTITFAISPTGDLLTWLQANGTKQESAPIKAGTYLFNEELTEVTSGNNLDLDFLAKGNSLTADNVYGNTVNIEHVLVQGNGFLSLFNTSNGEASWNLKEWVYNDGEVEYVVTDNTKLRTIILATDQAVIDEFYTWFTANTTKLS